MGILFSTPINNVSGNVFNDPNEGFVNNSTGGVNIVPAGITAYLVGPNSKIVATSSVATDGTYSFANVVNTNGYTVVLSTTAGAIGANPPTSTLQTGWSHTGNFNGTENTGNTNNLSGISTTFDVSNSDVTNINFGIQRLPESAVNLQVVGLNPGGVVNTTVSPSWFETSNVGVNPNTQDFDGGSVNNIRITAFPSNVTSITINNINYSSSTWPSGGVTIPFTSGTGATQSISVDPIDGLVSVVIPFVAIDNAVKEDPTPGSVTLTYTSILPIELINFTTVSNGNSILVKWSVGSEVNIAKYEVEHSVNGVNFTTIGNKSANSSRDYSFTHLSPIKGNNYYRLKTVEKDGSISYSNIVVITVLSDDKSITVYPNPASDIVNISVAGYKGTIQAKVYDSKGSLIRISQLKNGKNTIAVAHLASGVYNISVTDEDGNVQNRKINIVR